MKFFFFDAEPFLGYCPIYIVKKKIVLQDNAMYCNREVAGLEGRCIAIHLVRLEIVLQEE